MGAPGRATTTTTASSAFGKLKREDFHRTKHDSAFSKWKVLIGPSDWEDYKSGKEGAERYRVANLPAVCGPGLYEIGVAVLQTGLGREVGKLEPDRIMVVYLGQADNVRSRLQHYGRSGSHLVPGHCRWLGSSVGENNGQGTGLFMEVFSRGYPIVYRWAPMKSKSDAERMEVKLLDKFDYAWNKVGNGTRRSEDALKKIEKIASKTHNMPKFLRVLQSLGNQKVGIPIEEGKHIHDVNDAHDAEGFNFNLFGQVLKFGRSRPRLVSTNSHTEEFSQIGVCGVSLGDGSVCKNQPEGGRKRCSEHKGMRLKKSLFARAASRGFSKENLVPICGVVQLDGSPCGRPPFPNRKRCEEHKGMRVSRSISMFSGCEAGVDDSLIKSSPSNLNLGGQCGVDLGNGEHCRRLPVKERKRCKEHKGMRVNQASKLYF